MRTETSIEMDKRTRSAIQESEGKTITQKTGMLNDPRNRGISISQGTGRKAGKVSRFGGTKSSAIWRSSSPTPSRYSQS